MPLWKSMTTSIKKARKYTKKASPVAAKKQQHKKKMRKTTLKQTSTNQKLSKKTKAPKFCHPMARNKVLLPSAAKTPLQY